MASIVIDYSTRSRRFDPTAPTFGDGAASAAPAVTLHVTGRATARQCASEKELDRLAIDVFPDPQDWTAQTTLGIIREIAAAFDMGDDVTLDWRRDRRRRKTPYGGHLRVDSRQKYPRNGWAETQPPGFDLAVLMRLFDQTAGWYVTADHFNIGAGTRQSIENHGTEKGGA